MLKKILYILAYWIYFVGEGVTEAFTWTMNTNPVGSGLYHLWRVVENFGLIFLILLLIFIKEVRNIWISILAAISGLALYEFIYCRVAYQDWFYQKTSLWLGIPHPSYQFWIILFFLAVIGIIIILSKDRKNG